MSKGSKKPIRLGSMMVLIVYIAVLFYVCFASEQLGRGQVSQTLRFNLVPFREITRFWVSRSIIGIPALMLNFFGNVLAFVPFGFFTAVCSRRRSAAKIGLMTLLLSLLIETVQLTTGVGAFDVDDLILNTAGGLCGYWFFLLAGRYAGLPSGGRRKHID